MSVAKEEQLQKLREQMDKVRKHYATAPEEFLKAWKEAVKKIGVEYFECHRNYVRAETIDAVTNKWQLIPNYERLLNRLGTYSSGEAIFTGLVYSFYNSDVSEQFLHAFDVHGLGDAVGHLDPDEIEIINRLMLNHTGW